MSLGIDKTNWGKTHTDKVKNQVGQVVYWDKNSVFQSFIIPKIQSTFIHYKILYYIVYPSMKWNMDIILISKVTDIGEFFLLHCPTH